MYMYIYIHIYADMVKMLEVTGVVVADEEGGHVLGRGCFVVHRDDAVPCGEPGS